MKERNDHQMNSLGRLVVLVPDYDEAIQFYREVLGMRIIADIPAGALRFVHLGFAAEPSIGLWLLQATTAEQKARVGNQTGGQPLGVIYTSDLRAESDRLAAKGVEFVLRPTEEADSIYAQFQDIYGNIFVLVQLKA